MQHWWVRWCGSHVILDEVLIVIGGCLAKADLEVSRSDPFLLLGDVILAVLLPIVADVGRSVPYRRLVQRELGHLHEVLVATED